MRAERRASGDNRPANRLRTRRFRGSGFLGRGGGGAGLIAASIVAAGFLLGLGIFLAILLRSPSGTGSASETPSPPAGSGAPAVSSSPGASLQPSATGSAQADPLRAYVARLPIAFHACAGPAEEPSAAELAVVEFLGELYQSGLSNRRCIVDRLSVSMHAFESEEAMNAAYVAAAGAHLSHSESCDEQIRSGQGSTPPRTDGKGRPCAFNTRAVIGSCGRTRSETS